MKHIYKCPKCNKFTMSEKCGDCNLKTETTRPPKYSPDDKYRDLKRKAKEPMLKEKGLK